MATKTFSIDIKEYCEVQKEVIKDMIATFGNAPTLAVIQVGDDEASNRYIKHKRSDCEEVGITFEWYHFDDTITTEQLIQEITDLLPYVDAMLVQMPLPQHIDATAIKMAIDPSKDVDGLHPLSHFDPCTPLGIIQYCQMNDYDFSGKNVVILGRSDIVGKPLARMLTDLDATVTLCHSKTKSMWNYVNRCDLVITAVGQAGFLNCYSIHVPVIDVGINFDENGKLMGDCYNTENREVTPVPGGVGLLTRLALLQNVCTAKYTELLAEVAKIDAEMECSDCETVCDCNQ